MIRDIMEFSIPSSKGRDVGISILTDATEVLEASALAVDLRSHSKETRYRIKAMRAILKMLNHKGRKRRPSRVKKVEDEIIDTEIIETKCIALQGRG